MKIILASQSPRRKELMDLLGIEYEIKVSNVDETLEKGLSIEEQSKRLAYIKAKTVFDITEGNRIIIGSDTIVVKNGNVYGKPKNRQDAIEMIKTLKNGKHQVFTSVAILIQSEEDYEEYIDYESTDVYISNMEEKEIEEWVDTGKAYDKAGAYAIQLEFSKFIDKIDGNYDAVIGLPINKVYKVLKKYITEI